jgi:hypothetical protein
MWPKVMLWKDVQEEIEEADKEDTINTAEVDVVEEDREVGIVAEVANGIVQLAMGQLLVASMCRILRGTSLMWNGIALVRLEEHL